MPTKKLPAELSTAIVEELRTLRNKLNLAPVPRLIWLELFSKDERDLLSRSNRDAQSDADHPLTAPVKQFAELRGCSFARAIVDLAEQVSVISGIDHRRLRREIGEPIEAPKSRPSWNRKTGELHFRGELIRRRVSIRAKNVRTILDAFDEANWSTRIDNPLPGGADSRKLRESLSTLRETLKAIDFFADGTATGVLWQETERPRRTRASRRNSRRL